MKIYVVTKGDYSDYHICCATIDKEQAERAVKIYSSTLNQARIEEFDSNDVFNTPDGTKRYCVLFSKTNGRALDIWESPKEILPINNPPVIRSLNIRYIIIELNAIDIDHALKIASDAFAKYMAEKEGL